MAWLKITGNATADSERAKMPSKSRHLTFPSVRATLELTMNALIVPMPQPPVKSLCEFRPKAYWKEVLPCQIYSPQCHAELVSASFLYSIMILK